MIETVLLAFLVAKIRGYKLKPLFKEWPIYCVLAFTVMYIALEVLTFKGNYSLVKYSSLFKFGSLCIFLCLVIKYKQYVYAVIGSIAILIGSVLNNIAIGANNGKMPVFPTLTYLTGYTKPDVFVKANDIHVLGSASTNLKFLTDIFDVGYSIMSIGDILIRVFPFIVIIGAIKYTNKVQDVKIQIKA